MHLLKQSFRSGSDLLAALEAEPKPGAIFCPTTARRTEGEDVLVQWTVPEIPNPVFVRGRVLAWRPALPRRGIRAGATVGLELLDANKVDFVRETLSGQRPSPARRRHPRMPVEVAVRYRPPSAPDFAQSGLTEISVGGALLRLRDDRPLALGAEVILEILPPGAMTPLAIAGRVAYLDGPDRAGIKFVCRDGGGSRRLREIVRRLTEA